MRVVVFGGTGFVGLNVAEALLAAGDDVVLLDRGVPPAAAEAAFADLPGRLTARIGDVRDTSAIADAVIGADAAVYGAAITSDAAREAADPRAVLEVNLMGWLAVVEAAHRHGLSRLVNLSSAGAYGAAAFGEGALDETATAADPVTLYGLTKFASERLGARLAELWPVEVVSLRLSAVFGPWERATGVRDTLSPPFQVMRAALLGEPVRLERADRRDWVYAPDVARAVQAALHHPAPAHALYNVGPGDTWELAAWAEHLAAHHFPGLEAMIDPTAATVASHMARPRQPLAVDRLRDDLGVRTRFGLVESADDYAAWAKAHAALITG